MGPKQYLAGPMDPSLLYAPVTIVRFYERNMCDHGSIQLGVVIRPISIPTILETSPKE